jgi:pimeloyl-ACP methyl ester carboxylesterase
MIIKTKSFELAVLAKGDENAHKIAILIPGRLDTKDYANFVSHAEYLVACGFYAIAFDPPGTWESPGDISLYTTTNYLKAIDELIARFGSKPTLLLGHSRGGTAAILASGNPAVTGIVLVLSNYSMPSPPDENALRAGFQISHRDLPPGDHETKEQKEFKLPLSYWEDAKQYDPLAVLRSCVKPKLMISSTRDEFSSPQKIQEIYDSVPEPKMLRMIDSAHDYRRHAESIETVNVAIGEFLKKLF